MYEVLKNFLATGQYAFADAEERIVYLTANGKITPSQAEELRALANSRASRPNPVEAEVGELRAEVAELRQGTRELAKESTISMLAITELYEMMIRGM